MSESLAKKEVKIGVKIGGGLPPGYLWKIDILDCAYEESCRFLDEAQRDHVAEQFRELARQDDPTHSLTVDIKQINSYYEFRDKGGVLQKINVRVFFYVHKPTRTLVILSSVNKKNDGATREHVKIRVEDRLSRYLKKNID